MDCDQEAALKRQPDVLMHRSGERRRGLSHNPTKQKNYPLFTRQSSP